MALPVLTPSERLEAAQRIFLIKGKLKGRKGKGRRDDRFYVRLETALSVNLKANWRDEYTRALKDILNLLPEELTAEAIALLEQELLDALGPAFGMSPVVRRQMKKNIEKAYSSAKQEWKVEKPKDRKSPLLSLADRRAIDTLTRHNCFWLGEHYGEHIGPKISELSRQALQNGIGRKALAAEMKRVLGGVAPEDYRYWDVASSAALVRARSFGKIAGFEEAGITEYEVLAMGDERMCPICREMHGRMFSVFEARGVIDSVLSLDDPEDFKDAMPWLKAPPVGIPSSKLAHAGQGLPPYHGRCRCTVIVKSKTAPVTKENFSGIDAEQVKTFDTETRIAQVSGRRKLPTQGLPCWKYDLISVDGSTKTRRFFDDNGEPSLDVDMSDHNKPKSHPHVPHSHDWVKGVGSTLQYRTAS